MNIKIQKESLLEWGLIAIGFLVPLVFFSSLEWNPEKSTREFMNKFFGADVWRVLENLKDTDEISHHRDNVHPYFSLFAVSTAQLGAFLFGIGSEFGTYRNVFGTLGAFFFWYYLYKKTDALSAFAALSLLLSTMTVRVWSVVPETFLFGFFTLMIALNAARLNWNPIFVAITSLSGTITNVFFGLLYAYKRFKLSKNLVLFVFSSALICLFLSLLQRNIYPSSVHFFDFLLLKGEAMFVKRVLSDIPFRIFDFIFSGFVLPIQARQSLPIMSKPVWLEFFYGENIELRSKVAVYSSLALVSLLIVSATFKIWREKINDNCLMLIVGFLVFQLMLHCAYGDTPFLYSYHFLPFIIIFMTQFQSGIWRKICPFLLVALAVAIQEVNLAHYGTFKSLFF